MPLSILHISDLHRDPKHPVRNNALLDSLQSDQRRYTVEDTPRVRPPDIVVVSGDVVHGVAPDSPSAEQDLREQYAEALYFLNELATRFVNGDKRRVIIVPGNHDVSAFHFVQSLHRVEIVDGRKKELVSRLFSPLSLLRWCWTDFGLYEIRDSSLYDQRLAAFCEFYEAFYDGQRTYDVDPSKQFDIFDFPQFNVTLVGFCSCYNNDLLNRQGAIHPSCIADAANTLRHPSYQDRLRIAVWHHNTEGTPARFDYMDPDILQNLIDRGFSVGLHGHQHKPHFVDCRFRHGGDRRIIVVSAGTLCGGSAVRFGRAYNVIELDLDQGKGRLHLREMQNDNLDLPIWGQRSIPPTTGSYIEFRYDPPPQPLVRSDRHTPTLLAAQELSTQGLYADAAALLLKPARADGLARRLLLDCYGKAGDTRGIASFFDPPESNEEAIYLLDALWAEGQHDRLREILAEGVVADSVDPSVIEMRRKYAARVSP